MPFTSVDTSWWTRYSRRTCGAALQANAAGAARTRDANGLAKWCALGETVINNS
jgi:hypothetical protein